MLHPQAFEQLLGWQSEIATHHTDSRFTLLRLQIENLEGLAARMTAEAVSRLLRSLSERLPTIIGPGDVCTRTQSADFWVLMPQASAKDTETLIQKLQQILESGDSLEAADLRLIARSLESGQTTLAETTGNALMRQLTEPQERYQHA